MDIARLRTLLIIGALSAVATLGFAQSAAPQMTESTASALASAD